MNRGGIHGDRVWQYLLSEPGIYFLLLPGAIASEPAPGPLEILAGSSASCCSPAPALTDLSRHGLTSGPGHAYSPPTRGFPIFVIGCPSPCRKKAGGWEELAPQGTNF